MKHLKKFLEATRSFLIPGRKYRITFPVYDDYAEGLRSDIVDVEAIRKNSNGKYLVHDIENDFDFEIHDLENCDIEELTEEFNEGLLGAFTDKLQRSDFPKWRDDVKVSKRLKQNHISKFFTEDDEGIDILYLVYDDEEEDVAKIEFTDKFSGDEPILRLTNLRNGSKKLFLSIDRAIHYFLNYWEKETEEGRKTNPNLKFKKSRWTL